MRNLGKTTTASDVTADGHVAGSLAIDVAIVLGIELVTHLAVITVAMLVGVIDFEPENWLAAPLFTVVGAFGLLLAILLGAMIVRPIIMLTTFIWARAHGRRADALQPAIALLVVLIIPLAIFATLAGIHPPPSYSSRNRLAGLFAILEIVFYVGGDVQQQLFAWLARAILVVFAGTIVWITRIARARRDALD
ncbi:hypothetical protein BH11ACT2_BH11ACT2_17350 [soil metagenome]